MGQFIPDDEDIALWTLSVVFLFGLLIVTILVSIITGTL